MTKFLVKYDIRDGKRYVFAAVAPFPKGIPVFDTREAAEQSING